MIRRIVKMTFHEPEIPVFLDLFEKTKDRIRQFPGCRHLELWQQREQPAVLFTFSIWETMEDLELYRNSSLFKDTWKQTKILFAAAPQAWSLELISQPDQNSGIYF